MAKVCRATGTPIAEPDGDGFLVRVPSGDREIMVSISAHDLFAFCELVRYHWEQREAEPLGKITPLYR